jgi:hypothetical protein
VSACACSLRYPPSAARSRRARSLGAGARWFACSKVGARRA